MYRKINFLYNLWDLRSYKQIATLLDRVFLEILLAKKVFTKYFKYSYKYCYIILEKQVFCNDETFVINL